MNVIGWILSALLAAAFLGAGAMKLATPYEKIRQNPQMAWVNDFTGAQVKAIGGLEVLGAVGVIVPWLVDLARVLTPLAAVGLALIMIGAAITHARRDELRQALPVNSVLFVLAAAVAVIRFTQL